MNTAERVVTDELVAIANEAYCDKAWIPRVPERLIWMRAALEAYERAPASMSAGVTAWRSLCVRAIQHLQTYAECPHMDSCNCYVCQTLNRFADLVAQEDAAERARANNRAGVEDESPCPVCGCEVRTPAGYLQCECPARTAGDAKGAG